MTSWKTRPFKNHPRPSKKLQWGHDFDVVEDIANLGMALVEFLKLQWGHDFDVVEDVVRFASAEPLLEASMGPRL